MLGVGAERGSWVFGCCVLFSTRSSAYRPKSLQFFLGYKIKFRYILRMANATNLNALVHWVTESTKSAKLKTTNTNTIETRIKRLLEAQDPLTEELIVYRAHSADSRTIRPGSWIATSTDEAKVRRQHIHTGDDCCLFKIHILPGIRVIRVDETIKAAGKENTGYDESEVIVDGTGDYYEAPTGYKKGFVPKGPVRGVEVFETYYGPKRIQTGLNAETIFGRLVDGEHEMIRNATNLRTWPGIIRSGETASNNVVHAAFELVQAKAKGNASAGGRRKTRRRRRHRS